MAEASPFVLIGICAILAGIALLLVYYSIPDPNEYKGWHRGDHSGTARRVRQIEEAHGEEEGGAYRERGQDGGRTLPYGEESRRHAEAARQVSGIRNRPPGLLPGEKRVPHWTRDDIGRRVTGTAGNGQRYRGYLQSLPIIDGTAYVIVNPWGPITLSDIERV